MFLAGMWNKEMKILCLCAHADDECACAGTLARMMNEGDKVFIAVFSFCEEDSKELGYNDDVLLHEFMSSMKVLKIDSSRISQFHCKVRHFYESRQFILDSLIRLGEKIKPDLVIAPSLSDFHQDHQVVAQEALRAFPYTSLWGYESAKSKVVPQLYVKLDEEHIKTKFKCTRSYKSQKDRAVATSSIRLTWLVFRGIQARCQYAEAFEVVKICL